MKISSNQEDVENKSALKFNLTKEYMHPDIEKLAFSPIPAIMLILVTFLLMTQTGILIGMITVSSVKMTKVCPFTVMLMTKVGKTLNALWAEAITTKGGGKISR